MIYHSIVSMTAPSWHHGRGVATDQPHCCVVSITCPIVSEFRSQYQQYFAILWLTHFQLLVSIIIAVASSSSSSTEDKIVILLCGNMSREELPFLRVLESHVEYYTDIA
jgi:hypothetical protein